MKEPCDGWTVETLKEYIESLLAERAVRIEQRIDTIESSIALGFTQSANAVKSALDAADRAVQKAETAAEKRFESVNEFRNTLGDQQRNLIPRTEAQVLINALADKISDLTKQLDMLQAERAGIKGGWGYAVGVIGFVMTIAGLLMLFTKMNAG